MQGKRIVFVSSSRDMADWAAHTIAHVRDFAQRHGLSDLEVLDYRDIDPCAKGRRDRVDGGAAVRSRSGSEPLTRPVCGPHSPDRRRLNDRRHLRQLGRVHPAGRRPCAGTER